MRLAVPSWVSFLVFEDTSVLDYWHCMYKKCLSLSYICLMLPVRELTEPDLALYIPLHPSFQSSGFGPGLVRCCWLGFCQRSGLVIIPAERTVHCKSFPLLRLHQFLLPYIQSSIHVWTAKEEKMHDSPQGSQHSYVCKTSSRRSDCKAIVNPH